MRCFPVLLGVLLVAGCDVIDNDDDPRWQATLESRTGFEGVGGTAFVTTTATASTATVNLTGATAGGIHPWHIHTGTCASGGPILGDATAYAALQPASNGQDARTATIDVVLQTTQSYFINVHASPQDLGTIVACGDLVLD
jgi:Cu/Zn superoxide dismutase